MMKKVLSLVLAILMLVSAGAFAAEISDGSFPDVSDEHANSEAIKHYAQAGVINGYPDGTFGPDKPITRGEFVKMLMVMHGSENANTEGVKTGFPDVDASEGKEAHWAHPHIKTAVDLKIINGYPDGTFRPDDNVKYEEAIKMMVCYLGKESAAKDRADAANIALYPEGYIRIANENLININLSSTLGENASRADVAQILYNSKDISRSNHTQTNTGSGSGTIIVPSIGGGGGGGFGGGGGGGAAVAYTLDQSISMGRNWMGSRDGVVVAASKLDVNGRKQQYFLEGDGTGITTREGLRDTISAYQLIVKMDIPVAGYNYVLFTNEMRDTTYYNFLGHHVSVNFIYNGDRDAFNIRAISSLQESDTIGSVASGTILKAKTDAYNANAAEIGNYGIIYYDARTDKEITLKLPLDLNSLKVIYNERIVNTSPAPTGTPFESIDDLIPDNGTISYVKEDRNTYRLIRVTDSETYVAGTIITSVPRGIEDKYRKDTDGTTPLRLTLDDRSDSGIDLTVKNTSGNDVAVSSIRKGNILNVASSKCGKYINVTVYTNTLTNQKIVGMSNEEGIAFEGNVTKYYPYSDYYKAYVKDGVDIEISDRVTVCLNAAGEITWLEETEPEYTIGYLVNAWKETTQEQTVIKAKIMTAEDAAEFKTYTITNTTKIGTPSVEGETYIAGTKTKYSDMEEILNVLKAQADIINDGKSEYSRNATYAQPIRYVLSGNNIEILETMALDTDNKFTGTPMTYSVDEGNKFSGNNTQFGASSDAMYIFVPNSREWAANIYKMGNASRVSSKLINYGKYNIEPYFLPNANGGFARKVFVIYNENIDAQPNYRSETIIVENKIQDLNSAGVGVYKITPKNGYGNSKTTYTTTSLSDINAYVLDASFQRIVDDQGNYVKREVQKGDIIRFGYSPGGAIKNIEIVFDISEALEGRKKVAFDNAGNMVDYDSFQYKSLIHYYGRVGLITHVPDNPEFCRLSVGVGQTSELFIENYTTRSVLLNTYAADGSSTFEVKTMDDLNPGDMIYVWQYYSGRLTIKYIYAVRYEEDLMGQYNAENAPTPDPGTGGEPTDPGTDGEPTDPGIDA